MDISHLRNDSTSKFIYYSENYIHLLEGVLGKSLTTKTIPKSLFINQDPEQEIRGIIDKFLMSDYVELPSFNSLHYINRKKSVKSQDNTYTIDFEITGFTQRSLYDFIRQFVYQSNTPNLRISSSDDSLTLYSPLMSYNFAANHNVSFDTQTANFSINPLIDSPMVLILFMALASNFRVHLVNSSNETIRNKIISEAINGYPLLKSEIHLAQSFGVARDAPLQLPEHFIF